MTGLAPSGTMSLYCLSPRRNGLVQPMMGVMAPSFGHGHAGAALGITAAVNTVAAVAEECRAAAQQGAMRPAVFPVAEVWGRGSVLARAELHWRGFHPPTQVHLCPLRAQRLGRVQLDRQVEGEEIQLQERVKEWGDVSSTYMYVFIFSTNIQCFFQ